MKIQINRCRVSQRNSKKKRKLRLKKRQGRTGTGFSMGSKGYGRSGSGYGRSGSGFGRSTYGSSRYGRGGNNGGYSRSTSMSSTQPNPISLRNNMPLNTSKTSTSIKTIELAIPAQTAKAFVPFFLAEKNVTIRDIIIQGMVYPKSINPQVQVRRGLVNFNYGIVYLRDGMPFRLLAQNFKFSTPIQSSAQILPNSVRPGQILGNVFEQLNLLEEQVTGIKRPFSDLGESDIEIKFPRVIQTKEEINEGLSGLENMVINEPNAPQEVPQLAAVPGGMSQRQALEEIFDNFEMYTPNTELINYGVGVTGFNENGDAIITSIPNKINNQQICAEIGDKLILSFACNQLDYDLTMAVVITTVYNH